MTDPHPDLQHHVLFRKVEGIEVVLNFSAFQQEREMAFEGHVLKIHTHIYV